MAKVWMTDRYGLNSFSGGEKLGSSTGPFRALNLGRKVGDEPSVVERNRSDLANALGLRSIRYMDQVHSALCEVVTDPNKAESAVDAIILTRNEISDSLGIAVQVADCVPVVVESDGAVMAIHVGREGLFKGITEKALDEFCEIAENSSVKALVGPSICGNCYPLSRELYLSIVQRYPATKFDEDENKVDVASGVLSILDKREIPWQWFGGKRECVSCDSGYFSYRRDATTGRQAMVVAFSE